MKKMIKVIVCLLFIVVGIITYLLYAFPFTTDAILDFKDVQSIRIVDKNSKEYIPDRDQIEAFYAILKDDYTNIRKQDISDRQEYLFKIRIECDGTSTSWLLFNNGVFAQLNYFLEPRFKLNNKQELLNYISKISS